MGATHHQPFHGAFPTCLRTAFQGSRWTRMNRLARSKSAASAVCRTPTKATYFSIAPR